MALTLLLAKIFGLYFLLFGFILFVREKQMSASINRMMEDPDQMFSLGSVGMILGIILVVTHNVWVTGWPVLITIISWWILIKTMLWFLFTEQYVAFAKRLLDKMNYKIYAVVLMVIGVMFLWLGY